MKFCKKCNIEKELCEFDTKKAMSDGYINTCKKCVAEYGKKRYEEKKEEILNKCKLYTIENKEKINERSAKYRKENRLKIREKNNKKYSETRKSPRILRTKEEKSQIRSNYLKNRKKNNPEFKLNKNIRSLIWGSFKSKNTKKQSKTVDILGCSVGDFKKYIESKFQDWMNWDNHGNWDGYPQKKNQAWDLDHIIPLSSAKTIEDVEKLNHYTNFQPLCSYVNRNEKRDVVTH